MRIQQTENAMFDLASSEAGHPEESIRSLDNSSEKLTQAVYVAAAIDLLNKNILLEKIMLRGGWKSETSAMRYLQSWDDSNWLIIN
jgi:arginine exporter protein ArgO